MLFKHVFQGSEVLVCDGIDLKGKEKREKGEGESISEGRREEEKERGSTGTYLFLRWIVILSDFDSRAYNDGHLLRARYGQTPATHK